MTNKFQNIGAGQGAPGSKGIVLNPGADGNVFDGVTIIGGSVAIEINGAKNNQFSNVNISRDKLAVAISDLSEEDREQLRLALENGTENEKTKALWKHSRLWSVVQTLLAAGGELASVIGLILSAIRQ